MSDARRPNRTTGVHRFADSLAPVVLILLVFTATRLVLLTRLPLFLDEAIYIRWAREYGQPFIGILENKWLYPYLLSRFQPEGPESVWLARALSSLLSSLACASCIALGRLLDSRWAGLLAGLLYLALPFAVFHDRQALVDPTTAAATSLATVFSVRLARWQKGSDALLLGLTLAAANLAKPAALPYYVLAFFAVIVLVRWRPFPWRSLLLAGGGTGLAYAIIRLVYDAARRAGYRPQGLYSPSVSKLSSLGASLSEILGRAGGELAAYWDILLVYFGLPLIVLTFLSLILIVAGRRRRALLFLWLPAVGFAALPVFAPRPTVFLPARYLASTAVPFVTLAALSGVGLLRLLGRWLPDKAPRGSTWMALAWAALLALLVLLPLPQDVMMVTRPQDARLHGMDRWQYVTSEVSGYGRSEAAEWLIQSWQENGQERIGLVSASPNPTHLDAYVGPRVAMLRTSEEWGNDPGEMAAWLAQGRPVYFVDETPEFPLPSALFGARVEQVAAFPTAQGALHIWQVVGADERLRDAIHRYLFVQSDDPRVAGEYPALADALTADPTPRAVVVYPPDQLGALQALLADQPNLSLYAVGNRWPFEPEAAARELADVAAKHASLQVVFLQETLGDPDRSIETWLAENLYWEAEQWFGSLRLVSYQNPPVEPLAAPVEATFGETIVLQKAALLDEQVAPGGSIQVALTWDTSQPVNAVYSVFAHLVNADGELLAQHDGVPSGGLKPTNTWAAGTEVADRFVIALPADLPPGQYELWVGLYDPDTLARLPVRGTAGQLTGGPDYVTLGGVEVR